MQEINIQTTANKELIDISGQIQEVCSRQNWQNGVLTVFVPHTTAALTINENADPDVDRDILQHIQKLVPRNAHFKHAEGNSDAHILTSFFGSSEQIIVQNGGLVLGTWQSVFFCEFDGPRSRRVFLLFNKQ